MRTNKAAYQNLFVTLNYFIDTMDNSILQKPIQELDLSASFKEMAYRHSFRNLEDILNWPVNVLLKHDGFTYHHYQELRNFLKSTEGVHLLKTTNS